MENVLLPNLRFGLQSDCFAASGGECTRTRFKRAHILLLADEGHPDKMIAQMLHIGESTVHRTRQKFVEGGVEFALSESSRAGGKRKLDGRAEAKHS